MIYFTVLLVSFVAVIGHPVKECSERYELDPAITRFRKYIQIDTSKEENLYRAVEFWRQQASELDLPFKVFTPAGLPVVVITLLGTDSSLPSIMFNSHIDVVPAIEKEWIYQPYSAYLDENGDIYGRGTQDAKDASSQYMEVIRRLKQNKVQLKRTVHVTFMPDEETGGFRGIKPFIKTKEFKDMNVGFMLDEGITSPNGSLYVVYQDRRPWQLKIIVHDDGGHGYTMSNSTAMEKARKLMNLVSEYRDRMKTLMYSKDITDFGGYTSVNINMVTGGYKMNVIPAEVSVFVDIRLATNSNITEVEEMIKSWISATGSSTELTYIRRDDVSMKTVLDDTNPYWVAMRDAITRMGYKTIPIVCPATSDMVVVRNMGIPAVGFTTKMNTISKLHNTDEHLNVETFMKGIDIYYEILLKLANVS